MNEVVCTHRFGRWVGWENGLYRLICGSCGKFLGDETWLPGTLELFEINAWPFDYADDRIKRSSPWRG